MTKAESAATRTSKELPTLKQSSFQVYGRAWPGKDFGKLFAGNELHQGQHLKGNGQQQHLAFDSFRYAQRRGVLPYAPTANMHTPEKRRTSKRGGRKGFAL